MFLPPFEYLSPDSLPKALKLLQTVKGDVVLLAGGTDILVQMKEGGLRPQNILSLKNIAELHNIQISNGVCTLGAAVTISEIAATELIKLNPAFKDLVRQMATLQIRNRATIGGNLCTAAACADTPPVLLINDATVSLIGKNGKRDVSLDSFFTGPRKTVIKKDELLESITFRKNNPDSAYIKFGIRKAGTIPVVGVACSLDIDDDKIKDLKIAVTAASPTPVLIADAAATAIGKQPGEKTWETIAQIIPTAINPISDLRGSAEYRIHLAKVATKRALRKAYSRWCRRNNV